MCTAFDLLKGAPQQAKAIGRPNGDYRNKFVDCQSTCPNSFNYKRHHRTDSSSTLSHISQQTLIRTLGVRDHSKPKFLCTQEFKTNGHFCTSARECADGLQSRWRKSKVSGHMFLNIREQPVLEELDGFELVQVL